jgi:hypothetical protein
VKFIQQLSESKLLASQSSYRKYSAKQVSELVYLHVLALRILASEPLSHKFAHDYAMRSARYLGFAQWYQNATDLHLLIHALVDENVDLKMPETSTQFKETLYLDEVEIRHWLREISQNRISEAHTKSLFLHLDGQFRIRDGSLKAIRRIVQDWPHNTTRQKQLAMTRLLQIMRVRARQSDLLGELNSLASELNLELEGVANQETGDHVEHDGSDPHFVTNPPKKKVGVLGHMAAFAGGMLGYATASSLLGEDAAAASTASGDVAPVVKPLGAVRKRIPRKKLKR